MAVMVDEDYAHVVLICSGHCNDPDLEGRFTDITRQLHMLTTGYTLLLLGLHTVSVGALCIDRCICRLSIVCLAVCQASDLGNSAR